MLTSNKNSSGALRYWLAAIAMLSMLTACGLGMNNDDRMVRGTTAYENGEYRAAIIDAKRVLQDEPENVAARILLGRSSLRVGDAGSAAKELQRAIDLGADQGELIVDLGHALLGLQQFDRVEQQVSIDLAQNDEARLQVLRILGDARLGQRDYAGARDYYMQILAEQNDNEGAQLAVVSSYLAEKEYQQARSTLDEILQRDPDAVSALLLSGSVWMMQGNPQAAMAEFERAEERARLGGNSRAEAKALNGLVEAQLAVGDIAAATGSVAKLSDLSPNDPTAMYLAARIDYANQEWNAAAEKLQTLLRAHPNFVLAEVLLGEVHLYRGNLGQAEAYLSSAVAAMPGNQKAYQLLAEARLRQDKSREAAETLKPIIDSGDADAGTLAMAARASRNAGEFDEAESLMAERASGNPGNPGLVIDLAATLIATGKIEEAERVLGKLDATSDQSGYRRDLLLILAAAKGGRPGEAIRSARTLERQYPDDVRVQILIGGLLASTGDFSGARESFEKARDSDPTAIVSYISLGRLDVSERDYVSAEKHFREALALAPGNADILISLGKLRALQNDQAGVVKWFREASDKNPTNVQAKSYLARAYVIGKDFEAAIETATEALELAPGNDQLLNTIGMAYAATGDFDAAEKSFKAAIKIRDNPAYSVSLARLYATNEKTEMAQTVLADLQERHPDYLGASVMLAALLKESGDIAGAIESARGLVNRNPDAAGPKVLLAELLLENGDLQGSSELFAGAIKDSADRGVALRAHKVLSEKGAATADDALIAYLDARPADHEVRLLLAQDYERRGSSETSAREYEKVANAEPNNYVALNNLAWVYFEMGDERAEGVARRAVGLAPNHSSVLDTLGWILVNNGKNDEAVEILRKASTQANDNPEVSYHLAVALANAGKTEEAKALLSELLEPQTEFDKRTEAAALLATL